MGRCKYCFYWDGAGDHGHCKRRAPSLHIDRRETGSGVIISRDAAWPPTQATNGCGDFRTDETKWDRD